MTWRAPAIAATAGVVLGALLGWKLHTPPPAPAVHLDQQGHSDEARAATADTSTHAGPTRTVKLDFDPAPASSRRGARTQAPVIVPGLGAVQVPAGERLESVVIEDTGPTETETHATEQEHREADSHQHLDVVPPPRAPLPRWSMGLALDDALGARELQLSGGLRVVGPVWAEVAVVPARRQLGVGLRLEW